MTKNIGDEVLFGAYKQGADPDSEKTAIEWLVLDKKDDKLLVISKYVLDCLKYHNSFADITWEKCSLRKWLNDSFLNEAFTPAEQEKIQTTTVSTEENPWYITDPGKDTTDKVFLLSIAEAEKYFSSVEERKCLPTAYAIARGTFTSNRHKSDGKPTCWWWLRSPGDRQYFASTILLGGSINYDGCLVSNTHDGVRPAMWIDSVGVEG